MKKPLLFLCFSFCVVFSTWAQSRTVTGRVTAQTDGSTVPGVNVIVKGTVNGTVSDTNGNYSISVPTGSNVLVFSFVGMSSTEVEINDRLVVDVQMADDAKQLQEVVVNAIGETVSKDKLGIASSTVGGAAVTQSGESGLINGLSGKAAGVMITRNGGDPGAGSYIQLRGQSTITGDLQPLIVIDGMPMFNSSLGQGVGGVQQQSRLNDLNPADIESMEIIKSAAGGALWGSRAANGVIVITTKKGKNSKGKINVTYAGTISFDQVNKMPALQNTYGQGSNGVYTGGSSSSYGDLIAGRSGGPDTYVTGATRPFVTFPDGTTRYNIASGTNATTGSHGGKNSTDTYDHTKDIFQTGHYIDHNISLSSGNDRTQFYASYENMSQQGIIKLNSDYNKNVGRFNINTELTPKLHAQLNMDYSNVRSNRVQQGSNTSGLLLGALRTAPDFDNSQWIGDAQPSATGGITQGKEISYRNPIGALATPGYDNPFWTINKNKSYSVVNRFMGNFELVYDAYDWLSLRANTGVDTYTDRRTDYLAPQSANALTGFYEEQYVQESQFNTNLYASAHKTFSSKFAGSLQVGFNYNNRQFNNVGGNGTNFIIPDAPPNLTNVPPANRNTYNNASTVRTSAGFFQLNTDILDQININLTGRAESASTFGPAAQSLFFYPSATASWQFTKLTGTGNFLSFGKLRASAGIVGKQPPAYQNLTQYYSQAYFDPFGGALQASNYGVGGYAISTVAGNPALRPEKKHEVEVGTDLRFANDRFAFGGTVYYNKTTDAILQTNKAPSSGFSNAFANAGVIENKGVELTLTASWVKHPEAFSWSSNFIWSAYRNRVLDLAGAEYVFLAGFTDGASVAAKGQALGTIWGTYYQKNPDGTLFTQNGFPYINSNTGAIGNPNPNYTASFGNTFSYKNVSLYVLFDASVGGQMWNGTLGAMYNFGTNIGSASTTTLSAADAAATRTYDGRTVATSAGSIHNADGSYTFRGTVKNFGEGNVALNQAFYTGVGSGFNVNQPFVEDATWTRLREVTLSYVLNSPGFKQATKLQSVSFALTGRNLVLWTPYSGIDPDTNLTGASNGRGLDYFQNPNTRSVLLKLTVAF